MTVRFITAWDGRLPGDIATFETDVEAAHIAGLRAVTYVAPDPAVRIPQGLDEGGNAIVEGGANGGNASVIGGTNGGNASVIGGDNGGNARVIAGASGGVASLESSDGAARIVAGSDGLTVVGVPTSDPHQAGVLWNSAGTLKVSAGP